ncbi:tyrosine-type recombinase/integrase [Streptomyces sp. NPDC090080]|uniref:tyrosine-type recombinase/integrase n=1 Tax=Streptomyces sp. NPDC090080 TaxID=3365939 RepID=UPI00381D0326
MLDRFTLASAAAGFTDGVLAEDRAALRELVAVVGCRVWEVGVGDVDGWLVWLRGRGLARGTVYRRAGTVARFYEFLLSRYAGEVWERTGCRVVQPVDEFNRPCHPGGGMVRVPPSPGEVDLLFGGWREQLPRARKYGPAARNYVVASLWRRVGLRVGESVRLAVGDWYPHWGAHGKLHVRFGKGSRGRGPKERVVPGIDGVDVLLGWWLEEVRPYFGDVPLDPGAPMFPGERPGVVSGAGRGALRVGLDRAVEHFLPGWAGRLTPHVLRHFCASSLYERGVDLKAVQELLGHEWLSTTTRYVHVRAEHIERAWAASSGRVEGRLGLTPRGC